MVLWGRKKKRADTPGISRLWAAPAAPGSTWGAQADPKAAQCGAIPILLALLARPGQGAHGTQHKIHPCPIPWDFPSLTALSRGSVIPGEVEFESGSRQQMKLLSPLSSVAFLN